MEFRGSAEKAVATSFREACAEWWTDSARNSRACPLLLRTGQNRLVWIEHNLVRSRRRAYMERRFLAVSKHPPQQHRLLPRNHGVYRNRRHQVLWRILLQNRSTHHQARTLRSELHRLEFQPGQRRTVNPAVEEPVQRFLAFKPQRRRKVLGEHVHQFARAD